METVAMTVATMVLDDQDQLCIFFETQWNLDYFTRERREIRLSTTPPTARVLSTRNTPPIPSASAASVGG